MSQWEPEPDEDEQEEEEALEAKGQEQVVFLVDAARNMFDDKIEVEEGQEGRSSFSIVMETIVDFMKKRIVSGAKDEFAVVFYGTAKSENSMNHQNVYVYIKRDQPDASMIQQVSRLTDEVFQREIGSLPVTLGNQASLVQACDALRNGLWVTMDVLQTHASKGARHGIIMFSNTEDPAKGLDPSYRMLVMERGVPLKELGATLRFFPLISCKKPFNLAVFWQQLLDQLRDPDEEFQSNPTTQYSQLPTQAPLSASDVMDRLRSLGEYMKKCFQRRRSTLTLRWAITGDLSISCQLYDLFMEAKKPFSVKIRAEDNALLETSTTTLSEDTGVVLMSKIDKKQFRVDKVAERFPRVILSVEQLAAIKTFLPPGLKLLGFKPQSQLKDYHNMTHSSFLRPTERDIKGSTAVFKALLEAMAAKDNMAICSYVRTRNSQPCHVALIPQREETNEEGYQVWAEGLHLIRLPNKDDIRHPEMDPNQVGAELPVAGPDHVKAARKLIQRLQFEDFSLGAVPNPILDRHFEVLEHLAMLGTSGGHEEHEMPDMDDFIDSTLPPDDCDALAKDELEAFKEAGPIAPSGGAGSKRKAPTADLSTAEAYAGMNWEELNRENRLTKLTLPDLKIYLKHHKLPMSGNKADIVERIQKHMSPDDL